MSAAVKILLVFFIYTSLLLPVHASVSREDDDDSLTIFSDVSHSSGKKKRIINPSVTDVEPAHDTDALTDMREIKPFFFKDFIEITPENCSELTQLSKDPTKASAFKTYTKHLWVKEWKTSLGFEGFLDLLYGFRDIAGLKLDLIYDEKIETAQPIKRALQYYRNLNTLELNNAYLNDEGMAALLSSLHYAKAPLKFLMLKGSSFSFSIEETIKQHFPSLIILQNRNKQSLFASDAFETIAADSEKMLAFLNSPTPFDRSLTDKDGNTLLHLWGQSLRAQEDGESYLPKILSVWKEKNGDLDALNHANLSLFDYALQHHHQELIEELLRQDAGKRYCEQSLEIFYDKARRRSEWLGSALQKLFTDRKRTDSHFAWVLQRSRMLSPNGEGVAVDILTYNQGRIKSEKRYLTKEVSSQLWDNKGEFKAIHVNNHRMVGRVIAKEEQRKKNEELEANVHTNRIYFKRYPAFPGVSIAISLLQETLFGEGFLPLTFAKIKGEPYLLSPGIGRIMWDPQANEWIEIDNLHYILTKTPERLKELDPVGLHRSQLMAMLTNPEDGKPSNYALQRRYNKGSLLYGIDEEQGFVPAAAKPPEGLGKLTDVIVQMKSALLSFDTIGDNLSTLLHPIIRDWRPRAELEGWIRTLIDYQAHMVGRKSLREKEAIEGLFPNNKALFKEKETYLDIPFQKGQAGTLLKKLEALKRHVSDNSQTTLMELLYSLEPFAAQRYSRVIIDLKGQTVLERFIILDKPIYEQNQPIKLANFRASREEYPSSLRSTHLLKSRNIPVYVERKEVLKEEGITFDPVMALKELTSVLIDIRGEALIKMEKKDSKQARTIAKLLQGAGIDAVPSLNLQPYSPYEQQLILTAIEPLKLTELGLKNSSEVNIKFLNRLNLTALEILELKNCPNINDDILPLLEIISPTLKILDLSFSPNLKHLAHREGTLFVDYTSLKLPLLETLALKECKTLETILLEAPKLTSLKLKVCLKPFTVDAPLLQMIDARNSPWLTDGIIYEWVRLYPQLKLLKLVGNPQLLALKFDYYMRFLKGMLIYRPNEGSDVGMIKLPIAQLANPLEGTFDLSQCGDAGKYLSIATGYRKGKKAENEDKVEIWLAPRLLIEKELMTTARHFQDIMSKWSEKAPVGIFWTRGGWDNLSYYDYLTTQNMEEVSNNNLYEKYTQARRPNIPLFTARIERATTMSILEKFHVHFEFCATDK